MQLTSTRNLYTLAAALSLCTSPIAARPTQSLGTRAQGYDDPTSNGGSMLTETDAVSGKVPGMSQGCHIDPYSPPPPPPPLRPAADLVSPSM